MAVRKDTSNALPLNIEKEDSPSATITYANDVVAIIAGLAANEVEGIAGMCNVSGNLLSKNRNVTRGVKVEIGTEEVAVDLYVIMEYGTPIQRAAMDAQESVRKAIESMTGLHVVRVDVHVQSVSFEKENNALQAGAASAALEAGEYIRETKPAAETVKEPEEKKTVKPEQEKKAEEPAEAVSEAGTEEEAKGKPENASKKKAPKARKNMQAAGMKEEAAEDSEKAAE